MLFIAMTMIACSSDDSSSIEDEVGKEIVSESEKNDFEFVFTQKGDLDESIILFTMVGINDNQIASTIIDKSDNENLGSNVIVHMHDKAEGTYSYKMKDKVKSVMIVLNANVGQEATKDLEIDIQVLKDGKEVHTQKDKIEIGKVISSKSFTID